MKVYDDKIVLWNYGKMPEGTNIEEIFKEHRSMPRNRLLANAFFHAGFVEAWGRGFEIVETTFKDEGLEVPVFTEEFNGVTATIKREVFYAIQHGGRIDDKTGRLVSIMDDTKVDTKNITDRQRLIFNIISSGDTKDNTKTATAIAAKLNISTSTVKRELKVLQSAAIIEHVGPANGGYWKVLIKK